jgi:succinyl-diaminopimelate desuccinylase
MPNTSTATSLSELITDLVRIPTVSDDHAANSAALDWVEQQLAGLPLHIRRGEHNGVPSLTATTTGVANYKNPKLWLAAHTDVVPGSPGLFEPKIIADRMLGRGTYDMKSAIAVFIHVLQDLGDDLDDYDLGLLLTSDEEPGGTDGVGWLTSQGYRGQAVLLPDSLKNWELEIGAKGVNFWQFTSFGKDAHGSRIWDGDNAVERLLKFIEVLRTYTTTEPCGDPTHNHHTLNIGKLEGGEVVNQVPNKAVAQVDIRIAPGSTPDDVTAWVEAAHNLVPGVKSERMPGQAKPSKLTPAEPTYIFLKIAEAAIGRKIPHVFAHGGTDARWFSEHGIPVITINSTGGQPHTENEWIDLDDLKMYLSVVRQFVDEWAKLPS